MRRKKKTLAELVTALESHHVGARNSYSSQYRLELVEAILFAEEFSLPGEIAKRVTKQGTYPKPIERALDLYETMDQLRVLCEPAGPGFGPGCRVKLTDFDRMKEVEALNSWKLALRTIGSARPKGSKRFSGLSLLSADEKTLYEKAQLHYSSTGRQKPTLQTLAARILVGDGHDVYKDSGAAHRYVKMVAQRSFTDHDVVRYIQRVNSFGRDRTTVREATAQVMRETLAQVVRDSRQHLALAAMPQINLITKEVREAGALAIAAIFRSGIEKTLADPATLAMVAQSCANAREQAVTAVAALASLSGFQASARKSRPHLKLLKSDQIM